MHEHIRALHRKYQNDRAGYRTAQYERQKFSLDPVLVRLERKEKVGMPITKNSRTIILLVTNGYWRIVMMDRSANTVTNSVFIKYREEEF